MPARIYPAPGSCIFCLVQLPGRATDEHIIPFALSGIGEIIIKDGACESCQRQFNTAFENPALQADFLVPRVMLDLKRRRRSKGPKSLPPIARSQPLDVSADQFTEYLSPEDYPPLFNMTLPSPAGRLVGIERTGELNEFQIIAVKTGKPKHVTLNSDILTRHPMEHTATSTTLAKIAYCFAVAELGLDGFDGAEIRDLLMGRRDDTYNFVGSILKAEHVCRQYLHSLQVKRRDNWITVVVVLFASFGAPAFEVVVGPNKK